MYKVEYADGYKTEMTANAIESKLFSQLDQDGLHLLLFNAIIDSRIDGTQINEGDSFIHKHIQLWTSLCLGLDCLLKLGLVYHLCPLVSGRPLQVQVNRHAYPVQVPC